MKRQIYALTLLLVGAAAAAASFDAVRAAYRPSDALLLDRQGRLLHELRTDMDRRRLAWTPLEEISPLLLKAVVQAEDRRFYTHGGVDYRALGAAVAGAAAGGARRGASTITMQLAAMLDPGLKPAGARRSLGQKWRQMRAAWELEARWSKAQILEAYLNRVSFRGEFEGVAAAARGLFGQAPHGLDAAEAALLAVLIRAPNAGRGPVVQRALGLGGALAFSMEEGEVDDAAERIFRGEHGVRPLADLAPHVARRLLKAGGPAEVRCTLDRDLQEFARERLGHHLETLEARHMGEGAVLVAANAGGEILAYVSATTNPVRSRFVDGVSAKRQAGSTLKPFLYAAAFDRRILTPSSVLEDSPLDLAVAAGIYQPRNYDGGHRGPVSARSALASSMNVPAVRVVEMIGAERFLEVLREAGVSGLTESGDFYGPSLALGTADVTLRELVAAYRVLANQGLFSELRLEADSRERAAPRRVFSPAAAFLVGDILSDRLARSLTFGLENPLATRFWTAVKTGTSKDMRDNWCVGYSARYTVGVWVGNFSGAPMRDVSGLSGAAPLWLELMNRLHAREGSPAPPPPEDVARSGAYPRTGGRMEWYIRGTEPLPEAPSDGLPAVRISYPPEGAILAVDPDIPKGHQAIRFVPSSRMEGLQWFLDGRRLASSGRAATWRPTPGAHRLELCDAEGRVRDSVRFWVRGVNPPAEDGASGRGECEGCR
jgi:penicillin-binding protein 1C